MARALDAHALVNKVKAFSGEPMYGQYYPGQHTGAAAFSNPALDQISPQRRKTPHAQAEPGLSAAFQEFVPHALRVTGKVGEDGSPSYQSYQTSQFTKPSFYEPPSPERGRPHGIRDYNYMASNQWERMQAMQPAPVEAEPEPERPVEMTAQQLAEQRERNARVRALRNELESTKIHMSSLKSRQQRILRELAVLGEQEHEA
jgi:hypothetical protein